MRRSLVGIALAAVGTTAIAQENTSVLYGVVDSYVGYGKSGSNVSAVRVGDGGILASQYGFRGRDGLGGGYTALYDLQGGFDPSTGQAALGLNLGAAQAGFMRQAYVGMEAPWGTITLGRQYTPIFLQTLKVDPFGNNTVFSPVILWAQTDAQTGLLPWAARADNAVLYASPGKFPVQGKFMYAPGESQVNSKSSGNYVSGSLAYANGPWHVGFGAQQRKSGTGAAPVASPTTSKSYVLGAHYQGKQWWVGGSWGKQSTDVAGVPDATLLNLSVQYSFGTSRAIAGAVWRNVQNSARDQVAVTLGYDYDLSKRTTLYGRLLLLNNKDVSAVSLGGVTTQNGGDDGRLVGFGITHRF